MRIDYLTSKELKENLKDAKIHSDILGSDHCPIELEIALVIQEWRLKQYDTNNCGRSIERIVFKRWTTVFFGYDF